MRAGLTDVKCANVKILNDITVFIANAAEERRQQYCMLQSRSI